jgi:hypothetical protein
MKAEPHPDRLAEPIGQKKFHFFDPVRSEKSDRVENGSRLQPTGEAARQMGTQRQPEAAQTQQAQGAWLGAAELPVNLLIDPEADGIQTMDSEHASLLRAKQ